MSPRNPNPNKPQPKGAPLNPNYVPHSEKEAIRKENQRRDQEAGKRYGKGK